MALGKIHYATAPRKTSRHWDQQTADGWVDFLVGEGHLNLKNPAGHKECGGFLGGLLRKTIRSHKDATGKTCTCEAFHRNKEAVVTRDFLSLDFDSPEDGLWERVRKLRHAVFLHTTFSSTPEAPRYRVGVHLDRPVTPDEYRRLVWVVARDLLGVSRESGQLDKGSFEPERFMYRPATQDRAHYDQNLITKKGAPLPVDETLERYVEGRLELEGVADNGLPAGAEASDEQIQEFLDAHTAGDDGWELHLEDFIQYAERERESSDLGRNQLTVKVLPQVFRGARDGLFPAQKGLDRFRDYALELDGEDDFAEEFESLIPKAIGYVLADGDETTPDEPPAESAQDEPAVSDDDLRLLKDNPGALQEYQRIRARAVAQEVASRTEGRSRKADWRNFLESGGAFILDVPDTPPAIWGKGSEVLWAEGEALMIVGSSGVGKSTIAGQVVRSILFGGEVLGYPVSRKPKLLYLAMDRPAQLRRSLHRQFTPDERESLDERLVVWEGPPPADLAANPDLLAEMCEEAGADVVVVDSLKDAAVGLSEDAVGAAYNRARQATLAAGVQVLELHHQVKRGANGAAPTALADVFGSGHLVNGAGSVILLHGQAGDPIVELRHLKQPSDAVGPFKVIHDGPTGTSQIYSQADALTLARAAGADGITVPGFAMAMFDSQKPTDNEKQKARRKLESLVQSGLLEAFKLPRAGGGRAPTGYRIPAGSDDPSADFKPVDGEEL